MITGRDNRTLIDELIEEQRQLTAVERFAQKHERADLPLQSRYYRDLIPLNKPAPGQQYAFEVELDKCSACKACVTACHNLNGLDEDETWRSVGFLVGTQGGAPVQQPVTTACHHCVDPACLNGCPVLAYEKDPVTGIVKHLDDQCIGCQYCVLKCPYDVPKYSSKRGIVRKCDMCSSRLAEGEAPACVQACPNEAIKITLVNRELVAEVYQSETVDGANLFLPSSPNPAITKPSTNFVSSRSRKVELRAGDSEHLVPEKNHLPLVWMLVLTQAAAGIFLVYALSSLAAPGLSPNLLYCGTAFCLLGIAVSVLHLGRPHLAWKAFLGLRKSWLSREIVAFGGFAPLALLASANAEGFFHLGWDAVLSFAAATAALGSVFCSVMVYADTGRKFWATPRTIRNFFGTVLLLGCAFGAALGQNQTWNTLFVALWMLTAVWKIHFEANIFSCLLKNDETPLKRSAILLSGMLRPQLALRFILLFLGALAMPTSYFVFSEAWILMVGATLTFLSEIVERCLFFRAASEQKMPGGLR